ncbi:MAG: single-stranded DNA-binding protein [bacterium]
MLNLNRAMILGNATRDAELRTTPNGKSVASFAVATNRRWSDRESGETREEVQFHEVVAWGKLGEIADMIVKKGTKVYVEGRLQTRSWEGQDGGKREKTEIIADNIIGLSSRAESAGSSDYQPKSSNSSEVKSDKPKEEPKDKASKFDEEEINLDDIPF